ncbi:MAG: hypothetical protein NDI69_08550 [Bacteriovoracaceae bacterium]|nr:hypothetical protein [Bacteriovoracaceae bacterium]
MLLVRFLLISLFMTSAQAGVMPIKDNILFAFERCKTLSVDLKKGTLQESLAPSFDLHCRKTIDDQMAFKCDIFDTASNKKLGQDIFSGGSELGEALLVEKSGKKIKFLIGKKFASFESASENKVCVGIFIFEQDALKQKVSSPGSGL